MLSRSILSMIPRVGKLVPRPLSLSRSGAGGFAPGNERQVKRPGLRPTSHFGKGSVVAVLVTLLGFCSSSSQAQPLGFSEILELAQASKNRLEAINTQIEMSLAEIDIAKGSVFPRVEFSSKYSQVDRSKLSSFMTGGRSRTKGSAFDWAVTVAQPVYSFGRTQAVLDIADIQEDSLGLQRQVLLDEFYLSVIKAYGATLSSRDSKRVALNSQGHLFNLLELVRIEALGGSRDKIDLLRAEAAFQTAGASYRLAEIQEQTSKEKLRVLLGLESTFAFELSDEKNPDIAFLKAQDKTEQLPKSLQLMAKQVDSARHQIDFEQSYFFPNISLFASISGASSAITPSPLPSSSPSEAFDGDRQDYVYGVRVDWTLFSGFDTVESVRKQKSQTRKLELDWQEALKMNHAEYQEHEAQFRFGRQRFLASQAQQRAALLAFSRTRDDYQSGTLQLTEVLRSEQELREAEAGLTQAWIDWLMAAAGYRLAGGDSLNPSSQPTQQ